MKPADQPLQRIAPDVKLGKNVRIFSFTNLYGCEIGDDVKIGTFVAVSYTHLTLPTIYSV